MRSFRSPFLVVTYGCTKTLYTYNRNKIFSLKLCCSKLISGSSLIISLELLRAARIWPMQQDTDFVPCLCAPTFRVRACVLKISVFLRACLKFSVSCVRAGKSPCWNVFRTARSADAQAQLTLQTSNCYTVPDTNSHTTNSHMAFNSHHFFENFWGTPIVTGAQILKVNWQNDKYH